MTRNEYLNELGARIARLPEPERNEALGFYNEYFDDADNDEAAIEALGSPARLAAQIAAEYSARMLEESAQKRQGAAPAVPPPQTDPGSPPPNTAPPEAAFSPPSKAAPHGTAFSPPPGYTRGSYAQTGEAAASQAATEQAGPMPIYRTAPERSSLGWIWAVVIGIFALPVALPLAIAALAIVFSVVLVCVVLIVVLIIVVAALVIGGFAALFTVGTAATGPGGILLALGCAITALGLGFILIPLLSRFCAWIIKGIGRLVSGLFNSLKRRSNHENT